MKRTTFSNRSDFKLSFDRPRYSRDPKTNDVTCELNYVINAPSFIMQDQETCGNIGRELTTNVFLGHGTAVGVAHCSPEDTFDKHVGREIAEARAEQNAYSQAASIVNAYMSEMLSFYTCAFNNFMVKSARVVAHNVDYIDTMGGNESESGEAAVVDVTVFDIVPIDIAVDHEGIVEE